MTPDLCMFPMCISCEDFLGFMLVIDINNIHDKGGKRNEEKIKER